MPIQIWFDDSGTKNQDRVFVYGGLIAEAERWAQFTDKWQECLAATPTIEHFKFWEAIHSTGQFGGMKLDDIVKKVRGLAAVVVEYAIAAFHCSIELEAFALTHAKNPEPFDNPHVFASLHGLAGAATDIYERGFRSEPFEAIFDEQSSVADDVKGSYVKIRTAANALFQPEASILPEDVMYKSDLKHMPLQGADMLAGMLRRVGGKLLFGIAENNEIAQAIHDALTPLQLSDRSVWLNRTRLDGSFARWERAGQRYRRMSKDQRKDIFNDLERVRRLFGPDDDSGGGSEVM